MRDVIGYQVQHRAAAQVFPEGSAGAKDDSAALLSNINKFYRFHLLQAFCRPLFFNYVLIMH